MKNIFPVIFVLISLICCESRQNLPQESIDQLKRNLKEDALNLGFRPRTDRYIISDFSKSVSYLNAMQKDGSWSGIDYQDHDNNWQPLQHLDRLLVMTLAYAKPGTQSYHEEAMLAGIEKAITYWYTINPICNNWYKNDIAKQFYFNVIGLLLQGKIKDDQHQKIVNDLTEAPSMTGSNRTLVATSVIYRGVLENDAQKIIKGIKGVADQIVVTEEEGIQPDYSFHQHGHFLYNGSYGHNFLRESIWLATIIHGTDFAFHDKQIQTLRNYYLEGTRWMIRGGLIDYNARGRQVGRPEGDLLLGNKVLPQLDQFIRADPEYADKYKLSKSLIKLKLPQEIKGNRHFWRSDYSVNHTAAHLTTLKMCSERTVGIELNMNSENKLGYWLPYGLTYIYRRGDEYQGIFPAWDWAKLPGVTSPHFEYEELEKGKKYTQDISFVGGVSDGKFGISAMHFSQNDTEAKKAWFWFGDEWVALGAGINSTDSHTIVTGINQCHLNGNVIVDGSISENGYHQLQNPSWILHDSIAYIFPRQQAVELKAETQYGNIQRIYGLGEDSVYSPSVFSLWFDHGLRPKNTNYEYIVAPGKSAIDVEKYVKSNTISILENSLKIQAVTHHSLKITSFVFHEPMSYETSNITVKVNAPALILIDERNGTISLSDPTTQLKEINIEIAIGLHKTINRKVKLPSAGLAGKSVILNIENITS